MRPGKNQERLIKEEHKRKIWIYGLKVDSNLFLILVRCNFLVNSHIVWKTVCNPEPITVKKRKMDSFVKTVEE